MDDIEISIHYITRLIQYFTCDLEGVFLSFLLDKFCLRLEKEPQAI